MKTPADTLLLVQLFAFAVLILLPLSAHAADPPAKPAKSAAKSKPKPISREELRACMDQQDRLTSMRAQVLQEQSSLDQQRAEVARLDADLERKRGALDPSDAPAKQALDDEEARRNQMGDAYNARLPAFKERGQTLEKERQAWVDRCANKDFDEIDEYAIKRDRQRAAKAAGKQ